MRLLALFLLLPPLAASAAESIAVTADGSATGPVYIGAQNCTTKAIAFSWTNPQAVGGESYGIFSVKNASDCATAPPPSATSRGPLTTTTSTSYTANAQDLILAGSSDGGTAAATCDALNNDSANPLSVSFCVQTQTTSLYGGSTVTYGHFDVKFANLPPAAPVDLVITPGSKHLRVGWSPASASQNIASYDVHVVPAGGTPGSTAAAHVTAATSADVQQTDDGQALVDDTQDYDVYVVATDAYGNVSGYSDKATGRPTYVADFYNYYRDSGGSAVGGHGCASADGVWWVVGLALIGALIARRKKSAALVVLLFAAGSAQAAPYMTRYERPAKWLLVGLKIDRYDPKVDTEASLGDTQPYHRIFGTRAPLRWQLEADWEVAHPFGSILFGVTAGYWQNIGKGVKRDGSTSDDTALLDVLPFGVVATYRFDWLADRYRWFPFIPYAQAGLMRALWASFSGTGAVSTRDDGRGSGWTYGYTTALGVALNLDALDPSVAVEAFNDVGIQRTSLFAEYGWTRLDNFRNGNALILSDRAWRFGLALEF